MTSLSILRRKRKRRVSYLIVFHLDAPCCFRLYTGDRQEKSGIPSWRILVGVARTELFIAASKQVVKLFHWHGMEVWGGGGLLSCFLERDQTAITVCNFFCDFLKIIIIKLCNIHCTMPKKYI